MTKKQISLAFKRWRADFKKNGAKWPKTPSHRNDDYATLRAYAKSAKGHRA